MSPRSRMLEILAAANLAPQQLAMTQANAQRDVANTQALAGLAPLLVNTATQGIGTYQKSVADDADVAARKAALDQLSTTGEHALLPGAEYGAQPDMRDPTAYAQSPADVAKQAVDSNKDLNLEKPTGFFDSIGNLLGDKEAALAKARVNAQGLITNEVQSNRDKATALARQQQLDQAALARDAASTAQTVAQTGDIGAQQKARDEANAKAAKDEAVRAAVARGIAKGNGLGGRISPLSSILLENADLPEGDLAAEYARATNAQGASDAALADKRADTNQKNAAAYKDYASVDQAKEKAKNKNASALADVTDFESAVDNAAGTLDKIDGSHLKQVLRTQDLSKKLSEHGGIKGAVAGAVADQVFGTGDQTDDEATLFTQLAAIKAKSVKGLEGAHRSVSQHQIELVDGALGSLRTGNIEQAKKQLAALKQSANDTANAIGSEGTDGPAPSAAAVDAFSDVR